MRILIKIDVSKLDKNKLHPDDVDLPDMLNDPDGELDEHDPEADGPWWKYSWEESLRLCGQCAYEGIISPNAIEIMQFS